MESTLKVKNEREKPNSPSRPTAPNRDNPRPLGNPSREQQKSMPRVVPRPVKK